jgi:hypothetical protein
MLVEQLDHAIHAPDRQEMALLALRKLLVTEHSQARTQHSWTHNSAATQGNSTSTASCPHMPTLLPLPPQHIPLVAADAAEAEGVPARLLSVAMSGTNFGGESAPGSLPHLGEGATPETCRDAAALLADLTVATAMSAALGGRPAQVRPGGREGGQQAIRDTKQ